MTFIFLFIWLGIGFNWFENKAMLYPNKSVFPVVCYFTLVTAVVFIVSLFLQQGFLSGVQELLSSVSTLLFFWIWSVVSLTRKHLKTNESISTLFSFILETLPPLLLGLASLYWILEQDFKIGG